MLPLHHHGPFNQSQKLGFAKSSSADSSSGHMDGMTLAHPTLTRADYNPTSIRAKWLEATLVKSKAVPSAKNPPPELSYSNLFHDSVSARFSIHSFLSW